MLFIKVGYLKDCFFRHLLYRVKVLLFSFDLMAKTIKLCNYFVVMALYLIFNFTNSKRFFNLTPKTRLLSKAFLHHLH